VTVEGVVFYKMMDNKIIFEDHRQDYMDFFGVWKKEDSAEFNAAVSSCNSVDPEDWACSFNSLVNN